MYSYQINLNEVFSRMMQFLNFLTKIMIRKSSRSFQNPLPYRLVLTLISDMSMYFNEECYGISGVQF